MIYSILESSINSALELDENFDENGNINWDYIHADAYADVRSFFKDDEAMFLCRISGLERQPQRYTQP